ncbi:MAG: ribosome assembly cofactor RimP [Bacteroidales bacterium]|nr:ribosome assembly cofactor RimP [Bacteroidales bacterium]MCF8388284.1 ribosome assembly cofactor RimP [Bacteroidales bacterium]MCF8397428.1 ribosome assembly cofactor RimP [Bacteroidales bacterium]
MIEANEIEKIVREKLEGTPFFLVSIKMKPGNVISVYIDGEDEVSIDDCVKLSRHIESFYDRDMEDFELNVSSAGVSHPFTDPRQYKKYLGRNVQVLLKDGRKFKGKLSDYQEDSIKVELELSKKQKKEKMAPVQEFKLSDVKETKGSISFK